MKLKQCAQNKDLRGQLDIVVKCTATIRRATHHAAFEHPGLNIGLTLLSQPRNPQLQKMTCGSMDLLKGGFGD